MFTGFLVAVAIAIIITIGFAAFNYYKVKRMNPGTPQMQEIASAIQEGAQA